MKKVKMKRLILSIGIVLGLLASMNAQRTLIKHGQLERCSENQVLVAGASGILECWDLNYVEQPVTGDSLVYIGFGPDGQPYDTIVDRWINAELQTNAAIDSLILTDPVTGDRISVPIASEEDICNIVDTCETVTTFDVMWDIPGGLYVSSYEDEDGNTTLDTFAYGLDVAFDSLLVFTNHLGNVLLNYNLCDVVRECETVTVTGSSILPNGLYELSYEDEDGTIHLDTVGYLFSIQGDSAFVVQDKDGNELANLNLCDVVDNCQALTSLDIAILPNGTYEYSYLDENGNVNLDTSGYLFEIDGDSSFIVRDKDGNVLDNLNLCDVVDNCQALTVLDINILPNGTYELTYLDENGDLNRDTTGYQFELLGDSALIVRDKDGNILENLNLCDVVENCETVTGLQINPIANGRYEWIYDKEDGTQDNGFFHFQLSINEDTLFIENDLGLPYNFVLLQSDSLWVSGPFGDVTHRDVAGNEEVISWRADTIPGQGGSDTLVFNWNGQEYRFPICTDCGPRTALALDDVHTATNCEEQFIDLAVNDTPCDGGQSVWKFDPTSLVNLDFVSINAEGHATFRLTDCTMDAVFLYFIECDDGSVYPASVTITAPPVMPGVVCSDDNFAGPKNLPIEGNVLANDVLCTPPEVTTAVLNMQSPDGTAVLNPDGSFSWVHGVPPFTGSTSFTYDLLCDGVYQTTCTVNITVLNASANDDFYPGLFETPTGPYDATLNDTPCDAPAVTTYNWSAGTTTAQGGTVTGTPDAITTYTPPLGFCGTDYIQYDLLCDGVVFSQATIYWSIACPNPVSDAYMGELDVPEMVDVSTNDISCGGGTTSTWHLVSNPAANGGGLSEPVQACDGSGCPVAPIEPLVTITSWNQLTGEATITPTGGWSGTVCFDYFIRCTDPVTGLSFDSDVACVEFEIISVLPVVFIDETQPTADFDDRQICLGGRYDDLTILNAGDIYQLVVPEFGLDVEFIVGQDIYTPSGYQNDVGATTWASLLGAGLITPTAAGPMTGATLFGTNTCFTIDKWEFAQFVNLAGDGVGGNPIGSDYTWTGEVESTTSAPGMFSGPANDVTPKLYDGVSMSMTSAYSGGFVGGEIHGIRGYYHGNTEILFAPSNTWSASGTMDATDDGFVTFSSDPMIQQSGSGVYGVQVETIATNDDFAEARIDDVVYPAYAIGTAAITPPPGAVLQTGAYTRNNGQNTIRISRVYKDLSDKTTITFTVETRYRNNFTPTGMGTSRFAEYRISPTSGAPLPGAPTYTHTFGGGTGSLTHIFPTPHTFPSEGHYLFSTVNIHGGVAPQPYENYWVTVYSY